MLLKLSKASRNFIVSQKGLPGFIMKEGDYSQSCVCELHLLETSASFRNQYLSCVYPQEEIDELPEKLAKLETTENKVKLIERDYTIAYVY